MAKRRSEDRMIQQTLDIGRRNAQLLPKVRNWCRHLEIKMESSGLVAQVYGVPAGTMSISCPHASAGGSMSMHLNHVATDFITANCRDCRHHEVVSIDNIGREILDKEVEVRTRLASNKAAESQAKYRIRQLVSGDLTEALRREDVTKQSVLELVVLLDDEAHCCEAGSKLVKAAEVAPEFFTQLAIEVICSHFPDVGHGKACIEAILRLQSTLSPSTEDIAFDAARTCLIENKNPDRACFVIGHYLARHNLSPEPELVEAVVHTQWHGLNIPMHRPPSYDGSNFALTVIAQRDQPLLIGVLKRRLGVDEKHIRFNAEHIVVELIDRFPMVAKELVDPLIDSLDLDDDINSGISADGAACRALAAIYFRHPEFTQEKLAEGYSRLSIEGKEIIVDVYRHVVWEARMPSDLVGALPSQFRATVSGIIEPLLNLVSAFSHPVEVKATAADVLELVSEYHTATLQAHLDGLLGALANLVLESSSFDEKKVTGLLEGMEKQGDQATYSRTIRHVVEALENVCAYEPRTALARVNEIVANLESGQAHLAAYKAELAAIYGRLGKNPNLLPEIIPELYKLFLDFGSVLVRGAAVRAIEKILENNPDALPENMTELLNLYLTDPYVYVHQSAVRAVQHVNPATREDAENIVWRLLTLDHYYEKDPYFRGEVLRALINVTRNYDDLLAAITGPIVVKHCQIPDQYIAGDALIDFERLLPRLPDRFRTTFAGQVFSFLARTKREYFNDESHTKRYRFLMSLFDLPRDAIRANISGIQEAARARAKDDPWDSLRLVQLLSNFELHDEAAELAKEIETSQEKTKSNETAIREARILGHVARAESLVGSGRINDAINLLDQASKLEAERHALIEARDPRDIINTFAVANQVAESIK